MTRKILLAAGVLLAASTAVQAQVAPTNFEQAAYITCKEAHAMQPEPRKALAVFLADHAARYHGVVIPDGAPGAQIGDPVEDERCLRMQNLGDAHDRDAASGRNQRALGVGLLAPVLAGRRRRLFRRHVSQAAIEHQAG